MEPVGGAGIPARAPSLPQWGVSRETPLTFLTVTAPAQAAAPPVGAALSRQPSSELQERAAGTGPGTRWGEVARAFPLV